MSLLTLDKPVALDYGARASAGAGRTLGDELHYQMLRRHCACR